MSSYRATKAEERLIADVNGDSELMCGANSCPRRWSVDGPQGRLCGAHAFAEPHQWPGITHDLQRQWPVRSEPTPKPPRRYTLEERRAAIKGMAAIWTQKPGKCWAEKLQARERAGERLTAAQKDMWRQAIGERCE